MDSVDSSGSILEWDEDAVHSFLSSLGFRGYESQIKEHGITGEILVHLDHEALRDLGIHSVGQRLAILKAVYRIKLEHDVPVEEGHWVPPSGTMDQIMLDSPAGVIPPDRMLSLLGERDERIHALEISIQRLQEHLAGMRDEVHVINKTLYTKEPPVSLNRLRSGNSPTAGTFGGMGLRHGRSASIPRDNNAGSGADAFSPTGSPANSPTRRTQLRDDTGDGGPKSALPSFTGANGPGLQHASSLRRLRPNFGQQPSLASASANGHAPSSGAPIDPNTLSTSPSSPLPPSMFLHHAPNSTLEPPTPTGFHQPKSAVTTPSHELSAPPLATPGLVASSTPSFSNGSHNSSSSSSSAVQSLFTESSHGRSTATSAGTSALLTPSSSTMSEGRSGSGSRPNTSTTASTETGSSSASQTDSKTAGGAGGGASRSGSSIDNPYKHFRVTLDDPCYKVLPAAMKKYKINDDWRQYALFICYGSQERCLSYDEKPLLLFQKLKDTNQNPMFMLRHIKDVKSPIAVAHGKHAARREKRLKEGKTITGEGKEGPIREFTRATRLHHPPVLQPIKPGLNSPALIKDKDANGNEDASKKDAAIDGSSKALTSDNHGAGYALAIYPYMADREDEFDVAVGNTFVILNKTKGWWVVHRDTKATEESDIVRSGWVPQGCLLEISVPPSSFSTTPVPSSIPINPTSIVSVSTPGLALMDYSPRGSDEINLKKDDKLRVFKRYNHWSYVIKEVSGDRGWTPSWFVGKISSSSSNGNGASSAQSTPTSAAALHSAGSNDGRPHTGPLTATLSPPMSNHPGLSNNSSSMSGSTAQSLSSASNGDTTPTSATMSATNNAGGTTGNLHE